VYSILDTEWGMVKQGLEMRMWRYANPFGSNLHHIPVGDILPFTPEV
jgi:hypothetical protein